MAHLSELKFFEKQLLADFAEKVGRGFHVRKVRA
jgi:hypothetical protein